MLIMSNIHLKIIKYEFDENEVTSNFTFELTIEQNSILYIVSIPTDPICDIEILKLNKKSIEQIINKLFYIIKNKEFNYKANESIKKLYSWIMININPDNMDIML